MAIDPRLAKPIGNPYSFTMIPAVILLSAEPKPTHIPMVPNKKLNRPVPTAKSETMTVAITPKIPALIPSIN